MGYPAMAIYQLTTDAGVSLGQLAQVLVGLMLATVAAKLALQGRATMPSYPRGAIPRIAAYFALAFAFFALPSRVPGTYWLFHSIWCAPAPPPLPSPAAPLSGAVTRDAHALPFRAVAFSTA